MSLQLQNLIKPFSTMNSQEQLTLIHRIRFNRYHIQPSKVKTADKKQERKATAKKKDNVKSLLQGMSKEVRLELLLQARENN